jgi:hypothetical protein
MENIKMFSYEIDGPLYVAERMYVRLLEIKSDQYRWCDQTLDLVMRTYSTQLGTIPLYKRQLNRWKNKKRKRLKSMEYNEIVRLQRQIERWESVLIKMLVLAEQLKKERSPKKEGLHCGK